MIDINKNYRTREGKKVRILCVDGPCQTYPVVGYILGQSSGTEYLEWMTSGQFDAAIQQTPQDLTEIREPREWWINEYPPEAAPTYPAFYPTEEAAARQAASGVIGQIRVREVIEPRPTARKP